MNFTELTKLAEAKNLTLVNLDEQPVFNADLEVEQDCYAVVLLGDHTPACGDEDYIERACFEERHVYVSAPVEQCKPGATQFRRLDTDANDYYELADIAERETLEAWA